MIKISKRLMAIASRVKYKKMADIGTDHGYLPIYLLQNGVIEYGVASDVNQLPLLKAIENCKLYGIEETQLSCRVGDGLLTLEAFEVDTLVIAGMGGNLICDILKGGDNVAKSAKQLVLSPHLDVANVRRVCHALGFSISAEQVVYDGGKYYNIIDVDATSFEEEYTEEGYLFGKLLIDEMSEVFVSYCKNMILEQEKIIASIKMGGNTLNGSRKMAEAEGMIKTLEDILKNKK